MIQYIQYITASLFLLFGVLVTVANWSCMYARIRHNHSSSMILLCGGISMCIGFAIFPGNPLAHWSWVLLFLDIGFIGGVYGLPFLVYTLFLDPDLRKKK